MQTHHQTCNPYHYHHDSDQSYSPSNLPSLPTLSSHQIHDRVYNSNHDCLITLKGQTNSYISSLALSGNLLFSGSSDKEIRSWRLDTLDFQMSQTSTYNNNNNNAIAVQGEGAVKSLVVLADKLFSAHQDHKIRVWKINDPKFSDHHHHREKNYTHLATLPTLRDRVLKLLMPNNQVQIRRHKKSTWVHHVDTVSALALAKDESHLYSVSWDRTLKIWRTTDFKCIESVRNAHDDAINAVVLSHHGDVYTGSADKKIKVWRKNPEEKKHFLVATLEKHKAAVNALAVNNDRSCVLYSGASDKSILVWEKDGEDDMVVVGVLKGHTKAILCLAVVSDLVCSGSADKTVRIWRGGDRNYSCLSVLEGHRGAVKCLTAAFYPFSGSNSLCNTNSCIVYSGSLDCDIKVWRIVLPLQ